ncbi:MAG: GNAT family N-acetyltransferase, partial [Verrucomicrobiae bacterium]|nr:GNAT family N-acetyltransferase [Verrucomicrobiae bacterium]
MSTTLFQPGTKPPGEICPAPVAPPVARDRLIGELGKLPADREFVRERRFSVFMATAAEIPAMVEEIGRAREEAFREVGEGTGKAFDLDRFDEYYRHLFLWDRETDALAGAYRLGPTDEILGRHGAEGLYCTSLFHFEPEFLEFLNPGIELGRSFIAPAYQRMVHPLALLWRGIGGYLSRNPRYRHLFGPVSISQDYTAISKYLIVQFMTRELQHPTLANLVQPRNPYRGAEGLEGLDPEKISGALRTAQEVSAHVSEAEPDGKGIPVLLKHYLKLNATLLSFNV